MTEGRTPGSVGRDEVARAARALYSGGPSFVRLIQRNRHLIAPVERVLAAVPAGSSVLDIGCGGGLMLNCLAAIGRIREGVGIDASAHAVSVARAGASRLNAVSAIPRFEVRKAEHGLPEGAFDVVLLADVLHHVPVAGREPLFALAASRVRPGGILLIKEMRPEPAWRALMNQAHDLVVARQLVRHLPEGATDRWAGACALDLAFRERILMAWYSHEVCAYRCGR